MKKLFERISATFVTDEVSEGMDFPSGADRVWMDGQGELWNQRTSQAVVPAAPDVARLPPRQIAVDDSEIIRALPKRADAGFLRQRQTAFSEHQRVRRVQNIARFLEVNNTLESERGFVYRVIQAARDVSADYDLWKGPRKQVTFLLG